MLAIDDLLDTSSGTISFFCYIYDGHRLCDKTIYGIFVVGFIDDVLAYNKSI